MRGVTRLVGVRPIDWNTKGLPTSGRRNRSAKIGFRSQSETPVGRRSPMSKITRVGVDFAKRVLQAHADDASGQSVTSRALSRDKFLP